MEVLDTKTSLLRNVIMQYLPRFVRFIPLASEVKKTAGVFSENALLGAIYYLIWYMLASHVSLSSKTSFDLLRFEVRCSFFRL